MLITGTVNYNRNKFYDTDPQESISSNFGEMQMEKSAKLQVKQFFANFKDNATYIANIFDTKNIVKLVFKKQAAYSSFAQKVVRKNVDEINP